MAVYDNNTPDNNVTGNNTRNNNAANNDGSTIRLRHISFALVLALVIYGLSQWVQSRAEHRVDSWRLDPTAGAGAAASPISSSMQNETASAGAGATASVTPSITGSETITFTPSVDQYNGTTLVLQPSLSFPDDTIPPAQQDRLRTQLGAVQHRINHHWLVLKFYYTRYYMGIIMFSITGVLAAIFLLLLSRRGWEKTNGFIIAAFLVCTASSVFYGSLPGVFQQEQNTVESKVLYLRYLTLEHEIRSYAVTNEGLNYDALSTVPQPLPSTITITTTTSCNAPHLSNHTCVYCTCLRVAAPWRA